MMALQLKIVKCLHRWCCMTGIESFPKASLKSFRILQEIKTSHSCDSGKISQNYFSIKKIYISNDPLVMPPETSNFSFRDFGCVCSLSLPLPLIWKLCHLNGMKYICDAIPQIWDFLLPESLVKSSLGGLKKKALVRVTKGEKLSNEWHF